MGWLRLGDTNSAGVTWMKPAIANAKCYSAGFTNQMQAFVSEHRNGSNVNALQRSDAWCTLQNENPAQAITTTFSVDSERKISGPNHLKLSIGSTGLFKGSILSPVTGERIAFKGVVLQDQYSCRGFFLDGSQSGEIYLGPWY
jgi:hypothetical protein